MLIHDMSREECGELLIRLGTGRLACARDNQPYIVPVYFAYEPDRLYGFATLGKKIEWLRANPLVCVEVDDVKSRLDWQSVVVTGRYEEYPDVPEYRDARNEAQALLERRYLWWQTAYAAEQLRAGKHQETPVFYCVHIEEMSGRRAAPDAVESRNGRAAERLGEAQSLKRVFRCSGRRDVNYRGGTSRFPMVMVSPFNSPVSSTVWPA